METVIPKVGGQVRIVNGCGRGARAEVVSELCLEVNLLGTDLRIDKKSINVDKFNVTLRVLEGDRRGQTLEAVDYEDVCRVSREAS